MGALLSWLSTILMRGIISSLDEPSIVVAKVDGMLESVNWGVFLFFFFFFFVGVFEGDALTLALFFVDLLSPER